MAALIAACVTGTGRGCSATGTSGAEEQEGFDQPPSSPAPASGTFRQHQGPRVFWLSPPPPRIGEDKPFFRRVFYFSSPPEAKRQAVWQAVCWQWGWLWELLPLSASSAAEHRERDSKGRSARAPPASFGASQG